VSNFSRRHYRLLSNGGPDTTEQVAERKQYREACERARAETAARFQVLTADNVREALAFQEMRIKQIEAGQ
jgi:alkanesulfonate monooxygenase SsuD/methylene tetrahydromethanopterin reductase-like flavin-dependent oxidoreductase (luciferase family)